tara:strand:- start:17 stop:655 length:639 start_codon:yes stop_codon:yes gene_type:complete
MDKSTSFPEIISVVLYKYNSIDNKIFTLIMNECKYKKHKGAFLVKSGDVDKILKKYFKDSLEKIEILSEKSLYKTADTIYFLNKMLTSMKNLRWFRVTLDKNACYNRITIDADGNKSIDFDFKVIRGTFRTFDIFLEKEMKEVNWVLKEVRCITDLQYSLVKLNSLVSRLKRLEANTKNKNIKSICSRLIYHFQDWTEDNPQALIVTDFLDI